MGIKHIDDFEIIPNLATTFLFVKVKDDDGALILLNIGNVQYIDVEKNYVEMDNKFIELDAKSMRKLCDLLGMSALDLR